MLSRYSVVFAVILIVIVLAILVGTRTQKGRAFFHHLVLPSIGVTRPMMERTAACRFASGMALTLASGLDPERSLELVGSLNHDPEFQKKLGRIVRSGWRAARSFRRL